MKAINFKESNCNYAKNQDEYFTLPAHKNEAGIVTTCWKGSFISRLVFLFTGKIWLMCKTFNQPLQPLLLSVYKDVVVNEIQDKT